MARFKSPWFYWYTGRKGVAVASLIASALVMWAAFGLVAGFSLWSIIIAVVLDAVGFWIALLYLLFIRTYIPGLLGFQATADTFVVNQLALPLLLGFFVTRATTFFVAKAWSRLSSTATPSGEPPP